MSSFLSTKTQLLIEDSHCVKG